MAVGPKMKAAITLYVKHIGDREAFLEESRRTMGLTYAGSATYWHVLSRCPTDSQKTHIRVEKLKHRGMLKA